MNSGPKPGPISSGIAWGVLLCPVVFIGGGWALGKLAAILTWIFG